MAYVIKTRIDDCTAKRFEFRDQKTMYGGRKIAKGDRIYLFASEHNGGTGLIARGVVAKADATERIPGVARQTPRVSITVEQMEPAKQRFGRTELKAFSDWEDGRPETELNFKFYRQATNKIGEISDEADTFLSSFF